jgi:hypothetical protein
MGTIPPPTVRGALANGFQVFSDDIVPLLVLGFIVLVVGIGCRSLMLVPDIGPAISIASYLLIVGPLELGMAFVCLRAVRSGQVKFEHLIAVFSRYWPVVFANLLMALILPGATAFLVLPGFAFFCATRFVPFLLLEDELSGAEAIIESIRLSRDCFWQMCGLSVIGMTAVVLGGSFILGLVPALIWWNLSIASFYHSLVRPPKGWAIEDEEELEMQRASAEAPEA